MPAANDNAPARPQPRLRAVTRPPAIAWTVVCRECTRWMRGPVLEAGAAHWHCVCGHGVAVESRGAA